jgi:hypothetical protein
MLASQASMPYYSLCALRLALLVHGNPIRNAVRADLQSREEQAGKARRDQSYPCHGVDLISDVTPRRFAKFETWNTTFDETPIRFWTGRLAIK